MLRTEFVIDGRRSGAIEVFRLKDGPEGVHDYAWLVDFGGRSRRGQLRHAEADGPIVLLWHTLSAWMTATGQVQGRDWEPGTVVSSVPNPYASDPEMMAALANHQYQPLTPELYPCCGGRERHTTDCTL